VVGCESTALDCAFDDGLGRHFFWLLPGPFLRFFAYSFLAGEERRHLSPGRTDIVRHGQDGGPAQIISFPVRLLLMTCSFGLMANPAQGF
jgi:hypothetical protein